MKSPKRSITPQLRRDITDFIVLENIRWAGRLTEIDFLSRTFDLRKLPTHDSRFLNALEDIHQHREVFSDWEDDWIFGDPRFDLRNMPDEDFVAFLAEMLNPIVRDDPAEVARLLAHFNGVLRHAEWQLEETRRMGDRPVYEGRQAAGHHTPETAIRVERYDRITNEQALRHHLRRLGQSLADDPSATIGSAKELIETVCKTILDDYGAEYSERDDLPDLFKKTCAALGLRPDDIPESRRGGEAAVKVLRALPPMVQGLAELRNAVGSGHGRATASPATVRHARLAFNATVAVVEFLMDTWHERRAGEAAPS